MNINNNTIDPDQDVVIVISNKDYSVPYKEFKGAILSLVNNPTKEDKEKSLANEMIMAGKRVTFFKFWNMYGKRNKKEASWQLWKKLTASEVDSIFETLPAFLEFTKDIKFRPLPPTYLRGKRWEDELEIKPKKVTPSFAQPNTFKL